MATIDKIRDQYRRFIEAHGLDTNTILEGSISIYHQRGVFTYYEINLSDTGEPVRDHNGEAVTIERENKIVHPWHEVNPPSVTAGELTRTHLGEPIRTEFMGKTYAGNIRHLTHTPGGVHLFITTADGAVIIASITVPADTQIVLTGRKYQ